MFRTGHLLISSEEEKDHILTIKKSIWKLRYHFLKCIVLKCQLLFFLLLKFKLIEGYEVTTSPQKPELSPLVNRGILGRK